MDNPDYLNNEENAIVIRIHMNYRSTVALGNKLKRNDLGSAYGFDNTGFESNLDNENTEAGRSQNFSHTDGDYDPHHFGNTDNPTSYWGTVFHIITISGGPAILSIPKACLGVGYMTAGILIPLMVCLYVHCMHMIIWSEYELSKMKRIPRMSYPDVVYHAFRMGPPYVQWFAPYGKVLIYFIFITLWFFNCCYNYIVVSKNLLVISQNVFGYSIDIRILLLFIFLPFLLLFSVRKLNYLVPFSFIANILNYLTFILVVYYIISAPTPWNVPPQFGTLESIPLFMGSVLYTISATGIMIPLKSEMKNPKKFGSWRGALNTSYVPVSILFTFFSLIGYLKYGSSLRDSVVENLPEDAALAQAGILLSTGTLIFQYPLCMYVCFDLIWNHIFVEERKALKNQLFWEYTLRTALVLLSAVVSFAAPNIFIFVSLGGNIGTSTECFILPAFMQTLVAWKIYNKYKWFSWILFKNTLILLLASVFLLAGVIDFVQQINSDYSNK